MDFLARKCCTGVGSTAKLTILCKESHGLERHSSSGVKILECNHTINGLCSKKRKPTHNCIYTTII